MLNLANRVSWFAMLQTSCQTSLFKWRTAQRQILKISVIFSLCAKLIYEKTSRNCADLLSLKKIRQEQRFLITADQILGLEVSLSNRKIMQRAVSLLQHCCQIVPKNQCFFTLSLIEITLDYYGVWQMCSGAF